ncbi:MAG: preprotein translocase subunit SecY, partial [Chloroflexi bacterium]|nr:preprotein translocase subunit SecY [Chloroflexota bacterium]
MLQAVLNAWKLPDLRRKLLFTFAILVIFRFLAHIPVPGIDLNALRDLFQNNQLLGLLDLFSGGAMRNFSIAAMGVYPYITASIIMQLLVPIIPRLEEVLKEGEAGRTKFNQWTHWLTIPLAMLQAYGTGVLLSSQTNPPVLRNYGLTGESLLPTLSILISMTAGTVFLVWLGELITENGIGNGVSILIFAGIVAGLPEMVVQGLAGGTGVLFGLIFVVVSIVTVTGIVVIQQAERRIPVQYAKRIRGTRVYGGQSTHIPLKVNSAGMIPLIFAMSILLFPVTIASYFTYSSNEWVKWIAQGIVAFLGTQSPVYWMLYFLLVVGFTFFYTMVIFQQQNLAENLQKYGGFIPGIRPGKDTSRFIYRVLSRITWAGAFFLGIVAILPFFMQAGGSTTLVLSSTGILIVVG